MSLSYLDVKGCLTFKTEQFKDKGEFFKFLEENGIEIEGGYQLFTTSEINRDVEALKATIADIELSNLVKSNLFHYQGIYHDIPEVESTIDMLELNVGTESWDRIIRESLTQYNYETFIEKYNNANWRVSDLALGAVGDMLADKIREVQKERAK